jgi:ankyrin repeat protein
MVVVSWVFFIVIFSELTVCPYQAYQHETPLHTAIQRGDIDTVQQLIASGTDVTVVDSRGRPPLLTAMAHDQRAVQLLLNAGADVNGVDSHRRTALHVVCEVRGANSPLLQELIVAGADVNARDSMGSTACHRAAWCGNDNYVRKLIVAGADPDAETDNGTTPAFSAVAFDHHHVLKTLIAAGANVDAIEGDDGQSLLHVAAPECAKVLIAAGANIAARDRKSKTPLQLAKERKQQNVADVLHNAAKLAAQPERDALERELRRIRFSFIRERATEICIGLQSLHWPALVSLAVIDAACWSVQDLIPMHSKWLLITAVKHFKQKPSQ